ncbi:MAG: stage III sporulation protein AG [Clostridiales bacterium]|nr:stage III sporulation protein AG [Clostridiales bacterium]
MEQQNAIKRISERIKNMKSIEIFVVILVIAIVVSLYTSSFGKPSSSAGEKDEPDDKGVQWVSWEANRDQLEAKLQEKLSSIKGAGRVEVMITYKSSREIVPAVNTTESQTITEEEDSSGGVRKVSQKDVNSQTVTMNDSSGSKPLVVKEMEPEIKGVIVIAEGAKNIRIKMDLMRAVQTALGVSARQVEVFEMETNK